MGKKLTVEEERDALLAWAHVLFRNSQTLLELAYDESVTDEEFRRCARVRPGPMSQEALDWARRQISS
jgi:hypothetical protein